MRNFLLTILCVCDAVKAGVTEGYLERPKLRLYGESGVECTVEGAQTRHA